MTTELAIPSLPARVGPAKIRLVGIIENVVAELRTIDFVDRDDLLAV